MMNPKFSKTKLFHYRLRWEILTATKKIIKLPTVMNIHHCDEKLSTTWRMMSFFQNISRFIWLWFITVRKLYFQDRNTLFPLSKSIVVMKTYHLSKQNINQMKSHTFFYLMIFHHRWSKKSSPQCIFMFVITYFSRLSSIINTPTWPHRC